MPIVLSHRVAELRDLHPFIWLGAGEVDLKVGVHMIHLVRAYSPITCDCTYDEDVRPWSGMVVQD